MSAKKPLFAFFGTPRFATVVLGALESRGLLPSLVVCAPDKPAGRGLALTPAPAKVWARERGVDVLTPKTLKDGALVAELTNSDWDLFVVAAYNKLIPKNILDIPCRGCLNVHPSLLPRFRGPSPALSAILADERTSGVTIMQMDEELDHGPIVAQAQVELEESAWPPKGSMFEDLLAQEGGNLLAETIPFWIEGKVEPVPQQENEVTFTKKFTDRDALIDLSRDPRENFLKIRAFDKGPRAHFFVESEGNPSTTLRARRVIVTDAEFRDGKLTIIKVIPEGKKEVAYADFIRGQK